MNEKANVEGSDKIEEFLTVITENGASLEPVLDALIAIGRSGVLERLGNVIKEFSATDPTYLLGMFSSEESLRGMAKLLGLFSSLLAAAGSETLTDIVKTVAFNSDSISDSMVTGAKNPDRFGLMKMMSTMKDPDFASSLTAMINALKIVGKLLRNVEQ